MEAGRRKDSGTPLLITGCRNVVSDGGGQEQVSYLRGFKGAKKRIKIVAAMRLKIYTIF